MRIVVQPRKSQRNYIYDFVATVIDKNNLRTKKGCGVSINKTIAKNRAFFEAIERYFVSKIPKKLLFEFNISELISKNAYYLDPNEIIQESSIMNPYNNRLERITTFQKIAWAKGRSLTKKCPIWIPAFMLFANYRGTDDKRFFRAISCGVSIHKTRSKSITHGILELIERDAALLTWFGEKSIPSINLAKIKNERLTSLIKNIRREGKDVKVFLTTTDIKIPAVFAFVFDSHNHYPSVAFGLAAENNLEKSIIKSIEEALMILNTAELAGNNKIMKVKDIKNFFDHILFYSLPKNKFRWTHLLNCKETSIEAINKKYNFIKKYFINNFVDYLAKKGVELIIFNFSDKFLQNNNLYMTRVIARNLCPMFVGNNIPPAIKRLIRKRLKMPIFSKLNTNPHPFG